MCIRDRGIHHKFKHEWNNIFHFNQLIDTTDLLKLIPPVLYPLLTVLSMNWKHFFEETYTVSMVTERSTDMENSGDNEKDVDDLIFEDEEWTPSER